MEWVELIELTDEIARLRYYPEQKEAVGEYGEITYYRQKDDWEFDKLAENFPSNYALHACIFARRCNQNGDFKNGLTAWY